MVDKYFVKSLADLIWKDAHGPKGEVGAIDGDPLYDAQDMEIKKFAIGETVSESATILSCLRRWCWSVSFFSGHSSGR